MTLHASLGGRQDPENQRVRLGLLHSIVYAGQDVGIHVVAEAQLSNLHIRPSSGKSGSVD